MELESCDTQELTHVISSRRTESDKGTVPGMTFDVERPPTTRSWAGTGSPGPQLADLAGVSAGQRALDVGCGTGQLTGELVGRLGAPSVSAVDPSPPFVAAMRDRYPKVDVQQAPADPAVPGRPGDYCHPSRLLRLAIGNLLG